MTNIIATLRPTQGIQCEQSILYLFDQNVANSIVETTTRQWLEENAQQYITEYIQPMLDAYEQEKEREIDAYVEEKQSTIFFDNTNFTGTTTAEVLNVTNSASFNDVTLTGSINTSTAIFTDVIKMRASVSFKGAVAPSWSGIGIYELNDDDSVSLMASMEKIDGFTPADNNTYNIGVNSRKWKDLYLAGKAYVPTINNGADISVPSVGGTMALTSDIAIGKNNITNCITYIPQDIKIELNNGKLTLKAGSKVYVPNGFEQDGTTPKFDVITIESDILKTSVQANGVCTLYYNITNSVLDTYYINSESSGTSAPSGYVTFYNTNTNELNRYNGGGNEYKLSLPLAHITDGTSTIKSIDQVFNGFGYIGSTVFALPGVKGLIPNGRNADGSLKSIEFTLNSVRIATRTSSYTGDLYFAIGPSWSALTASRYFYYDEKRNYNNDSNGISLGCNCGSIYCSETTLSNFRPKTVFHALDYNDKEFIGHQAMPSNRYIDLTLGASGTTYTAPADGYFCLSKEATGTEWVNFINTSSKIQATFMGISGLQTYSFIPVKKKDIVEIFYALGGITNSFRFIYAEGSK